MCSKMYTQTFFVIMSLRWIDLTAETIVNLFIHNLNDITIIKVRSLTMYMFCTLFKANFGVFIPPASPNRPKMNNLTKFYFPSILVPNAIQIYNQIYSLDVMYFVHTHIESCEKSSFPPCEFCCGLVQPFKSDTNVCLRLTFSKKTPRSQTHH